MSGGFGITWFEKIRPDCARTRLKKVGYELSTHDKNLSTLMIIYKQLPQICLHMIANQSVITSAISWLRSFFLLVDFERIH